MNMMRTEMKYIKKTEMELLNMKNTKPAMKCILIESKVDYMLQKKKSVNLNTQQ